MGDNESHTKRALLGSWLYRRCHDVRRSPSVGEGQIVELISLGTPVAGILDTLCAAIDSQIGNVVSLVLLPDEQEFDLFSLTQVALQFGLYVFSSTRILSSDKSLLGTFQIYCCDQRRPNPHEAELITRVTRLAADAFQCHQDAGESTKNYRRLRSEIGGRAPGKLPLIH
ncbi:MAG TPA: hypothetical protein VGP19_06595 [Candidatus Acidoferrales bacterium]|jgi:hypothetical protein|nr:hypothetical protein [Candidatus Acidoferrales bacterium]